MVYCAISTIDKGRWLSECKVVVAAAEGLDVVIAIGGRQVDFGGGVGRDDNGPLDALAGTAPVALDGATDGAVGAIDAVQAFDEGGAELYLTVAGLEGADASEVFVFPDEQVAEQHHVVGTVHRGVAGVAVPELPDGCGTATGHISPRGVGGVGGQVESQIGAAVMGQGAHQLLYADHAGAYVVLVVRSLEVAFAAAGVHRFADNIGKYLVLKFAGHHTEPSRTPLLWPRSIAIRS